MPTPRWQRAVAAGATVVTESATNAFGQRGGRVRDPFGNIWWVVAQVEEVAPDVAMARLAEPGTPSRCATPRRRSTRASGTARAASPPPGG